MYKIQATDLFKQFGSELVLKGIDLFIEPGEVLGILVLRDRARPH